MCRGSGQVSLHLEGYVAYQISCGVSYQGAATYIASIRIGSSVLQWKRFTASIIIESGHLVGEDSHSRDVMLRLSISLRNCKEELCHRIRLGRALKSCSR